MDDANAFENLFHDMLWYGFLAAKTEEGRDDVKFGFIHAGMRIQAKLSKEFPVSRDELFLHSTVRFLITGEGGCSNESIAARIKEHFQNVGYSGLPHDIPPKLMVVDGGWPETI